MAITVLRQHFGPHQFRASVLWRGKRISSPDREGKLGQPSKKAAESTLIAKLQELGCSKVPEFKDSGWEEAEAHPVPKKPTEEQLLRMPVVDTNHGFKITPASDRKAWIAAFQSACGSTDFEPLYKTITPGSKPGEKSFAQIAYLRTSINTLMHEGGFIGAYERSPGGQTWLRFAEIKDPLSKALWGTARYAQVRETKENADGQTVTVYEPSAKGVVPSLSGILHDGMGNVLPSPEERSKRRENRAKKRELYGYEYPGNDTALSRAQAYGRSRVRLLHDPRHPGKSHRKDPRNPTPEEKARENKFYVLGMVISLRAQNAKRHERLEAELFSYPGMTEEFVQKQVSSMKGE